MFKSITSCTFPKQTEQTVNVNVVMSQILKCSHPKKGQPLDKTAEKFLWVFLNATFLFLS